MQTDAFNHAPGADLHEHRRAAVRPAEHGRVGDLRPGQRVAGPAGLRRLQHRPEGHQRRRRELGQRLPADRLPGRAVPQPGRPGPLPLQPRRRRRRAAARLARRDPQPERAAPRRGRRPGDRDAHQLVRDGLPDAVERAGADGPVEGVEGDARDVRRRAGRSRRYANNCLLARRLVERGVRFVQIFHEAWDHHGGLVGGPEGAVQARPTRPAPRW